MSIDPAFDVTSFIDSIRSVANDLETVILVQPPSGNNNLR